MKRHLGVFTFLQGAATAAVGHRSTSRRGLSPMQECTALMARAMLRAVPATGLLLASGLMGCSGSDDDDDAVYQTPDVTPDDVAVDVTGVYAYKQVLSQFVKKVGSDDYEHQTLTAFAYGPVTPGSSSDRVVWTDWICLIELSDLSGSDLAILPGYYDNPATAPVEFQLSGPGVGASATISKQVELFGVELEDPLEELPTDPDDPRINDYDHDGNPGFTITVDNIVDGTIWAIQRYTYQLNGTVVSENEISGLIDGFSENSYIYTSAPFLPSEDISYPDTESGHNYFQMLRVSSDYSCDRLVADKDSLFTQ